MDSFETLRAKTDASLVMMRAASVRGHNVYYLAENGIIKHNAKICFRVDKLKVDEKSIYTFSKQETVILTEDEVDVIFIRTDPPFDEEYLINTWLLDELTKKILIINEPRGIRTANEKIWSTRFASIMPDTLITTNKDDYLSFLKDQKEIIIKPIQGHGGEAIFYIKNGDHNSNVIFETLSEKGSKHVFLQKYLPEAETIGDKRILLLGGNSIGSLMRKRHGNDHRNNYYAGGTYHKSVVTKEDQKIIDEIRPGLKALGLYYVGIDIIGGKLIEINVTSPGCLLEISQFDNRDLAKEIIEFTEKKILSLR
jgi:glutathione synthase